MRGQGIFAAVLMFSSPAFGKQEFYDALVAGTGMCHDCSLCHPGPVGLTIPTTADFETKPFLVYLYTGGHAGSLPEPAQDSDMDGVTDLAELTGDGMGGGFGDPNDPTVLLGGFECPTGPSPEYGCARIAPGARKLDPWGLLAALALVVFVRRRVR
jgi:hypothetical protein